MNTMSLESRKVTTFFVIFGFISFVIYFTFQQIFHDRQNEDTFRSLMPVTMRQVYSNYTFSRTHSMVIGRTWRFVAAYQWIWSLYSLVTIFRREAIHILPTHFYISWSTSCFFEICQLLLISRSSMLWAWICSCAGAIFRGGCLFIAFASLFEFLAAYANKHRSANRFDVWCQRFLVQNGLLCFQAWSSLTICVDFATILTRLSTLSAQHAAYYGLLIFGFVTVTWFITQNFYFEKYTRYSIAEYVSMIVLTSLMFTVNKYEVDGRYAICLLLLLFSVLLFAFRITLILFNEGERKDASDEELEYMM